MIAKAKRRGFLRNCLRSLIRKWKKNQRKNLAAIVMIKIKVAHAAASNRLVNLLCFWSQSRF